MQVSVSFRHMDPSDSVQTYASDKLQHVVQKYITGQDIDSQVVFSVERFWHVANFTININGLTVKSVEKTENMYSSIDKALEKVERQVRRYKDKIRDHKPSQSRPRAFTMNVIAVAEEPEADTPGVSDEASFVAHQNDASPAETAAAPANGVAESTTNGAAVPEAQIVKSETYIAPTMDVQEAIMHLNLRNAAFFVFTNSGNENLSIVYRRDDGRYSVIEPEAQVPG